jgi:RNA polymerase sigma-70 factor (ECF subfamily)
VIDRETFQIFFRESYGQVCALLVRRFGDLDLAQEAIQEAFIVALNKWPRNGPPRNVPGWIFAIARHKAIDILRREQLRDKKYRSLHSGQSLFTERDGPDDVWDEEEIPDERLRLIFTCCHPVLNQESRIALTLHTLAGLTTAEIAAAFLKSEPTIAQRIVRAKRKIRVAGVPFRVPALAETPERLSSVLTVLYLIFNEGYSAHGGEQLMRKDLCEEAISLAGMLASLMPDEPEVSAQLALFCFQASRMSARLNSLGEPVTLEHQDRGRWDSARIARGRVALEHSLRTGGGGMYQLQAQIAGTHAAATTYEETQWSRIVAFYESLLEYSPTPVIHLNLAVAIAMERGPSAGLAILDAADLAEPLAAYHWYHLARAELLAKVGDLEKSVCAFHRALSTCENETERAFIRGRLDEIQ